MESILNISNNNEITWSYDSQSDSWTMSVTSAVANPELPDYQGVSVNVPGAYVKGIDTDGDGTADVTGQSASEEVNGQLVIDDTAEITNENGQTYTAATAPVIINTGAAGYSAQENQKASSGNAAYGYINVACGNRGKQSTATDESGEEYYTGDAPLCLVDQKNAIRFVKYNIILGNLPGNTGYFVSAGDSGGGAHAAMVAATSDNSDYFPYEVEAGAVGIYQKEDGTYSETLETVDAEISDGVWGCVAYSAIASLQEADMAMAFEYYLDTDYEFNTNFQKKMAEYLSEEYMDYINGQNLSIRESAVDSDGNALSDETVAQMTTEEKAQAFLEGRYAKGTSGDQAGPGGKMPDGGAPEEKEQDDDLVTSGMGEEVGTPDAGTTQSAGTKTDSSNYSSYEEMLESYQSDIASVEEGDKYGNNIVDLYDPINYIGSEDTKDPTWIRIVMGASEGDMSLFASMNMQIA